MRLFGFSSFYIYVYIYMYMPIYIYLITLLKYHNETDNKSMNKEAEDTSRSTS